MAYGKKGNNSKRGSLTKKQQSLPTALKKRIMASKKKK